MYPSAFFWSYSLLSHIENRYLTNRVKACRDHLESSRALSWTNPRWGSSAWQWGVYPESTDSRNILKQYQTLIWRHARHLAWGVFAHFYLLLLKRLQSPLLVRPGRDLWHVYRCVFERQFNVTGETGLCLSLWLYGGPPCLHLDLEDPPTPLPSFSQAPHLST